MEETILFVEKAVVIWFIFQIGYSISVLLIGNTMIEYYEWGIFENPSTSYEKIINTLLMVTVGVGPFVYKKLNKYNWLIRKILMLAFLVLFVIIGVIIYQIVSIVLRSLLL
ncbi:hypothetical protein [Mesobacillus jeotgali]|uniref:Uncharacterized protein n=1 Tax=Mesobacillus jeotgali TaxID=129985 RepID=A0ABY9VFK2_9BACI|nr:hypothetical protein [Mesobacillus jeotgali]WNF22704.1 hypothetical protein RH061_21535 [Mesobacillus jeotgali]